MKQCKEARVFSRRTFAGLCATGAMTAMLATLPGCGTSGKNEASAGNTQGGAAAAPRTIVDDAGREVVIPAVADLKRIYPSSALAQIYCLSLAPELLVGSCVDYNEAELAYLPSEFADLPNLGTLSGKGELNREALIDADVQVLFSIGNYEISESDIATAEDLQEQTGIPVVLIDASFEKVEQAYELLGKCLGYEEEARTLGEYCSKVYADVTTAVAKIPDAERVTLYYAEGEDGLQTEPAASTHAAAFLAAGAKIVAEVEAGSKMGMNQVSLESVLAWNPQVIIAWDDMIRGGADEAIRTNPDWSQIDAVKNGRVYTMPNTPFAWCDRPGAVNRFLGIQWVANLLYPQVYDVNMVEVTREFYSLFYHVELSDEEAKELLGNSYAA